VTLDMPAPLNDTIPLIVFIAYQIMFAIINEQAYVGVL
jgi:ammonia channel protein AmtB